MAITIKSQREIALMREAGKLLEEVHFKMAELIKPGISTYEIDKKGEEYIRATNSIPSCKNYEGYPNAICISVNDEVVHGIPSKEVILKEGDIVSLDTCLTHDGYSSDAARSYGVGTITDENRKLLDVTKKSFFVGIEKAVAGAHLYDISKAIQTYVEGNGFSVVKDLTGHGIGKDIHEEPQIPNFKPVGRGPKLVPGMTLAVEPMVNAGTWKVWILEDDWTVVTRDGSNSAHYENTILITDGEPEIFTLSERQ